MNEKRINSLQGLRAIAFIAIFSEHAGVTHLGSWGVSCFIILSGFLMYYSYGNKLGQHSHISVKENFKFAIRKISKLYPLHILTFIWALIFYWDSQRIDSIRHIILFFMNIIANIFLVQSWAPKSEFYWAFNAVSWYLSTQFAMYFAFPYIAKRINETKRNETKIIWGVLIIIIQVTISSLLCYFDSEVQRIPLILSDDLTRYITYICPVYRLGDFFIGCLLGDFFTNSTKKNKVISLNKWLVSSIEGGGFGTILILQFVYNNSITVLGTPAFKYTLLYTLNVILIVFVLSCNKGIISNGILSAKGMVFIGDVSGYAFLIHQLIIVIFAPKCSKLSTIFCGFIITIFLAFCFSVLEEKFQISQKFTKVIMERTNITE